MAVFLQSENGTKVEQINVHFCFRINGIEAAQVSSLFVFLSSAQYTGGRRRESDSCGRGKPHSLSCSGCVRNCHLLGTVQCFLAGRFMPRGCLQAFDRDVE